MSALLEKRLAQLINTDQGHLLQGGQLGLEKETLRVGADGKIAQTTHPKCLGSPLTNPYITTDYSEALTEIISPPMGTLGDALDFLRDAQTFVYSCLDDELLWSTSMPCVVPGETGIPIAQYGKSNAGMMKTVYRRGLGYRYGRVMQVIAGVHFNYSLPEAFWPVFQDLEGDPRAPIDFKSSSYFALIRNLQRFGWLVPYLFGASPAVCKSFLGGSPTKLSEFDEFTYFEPFATSLRMGDIGYQNNKEHESGVKANYNTLESYLECLRRAVKTPSPEYKKFGVVVDGEYRQLNANLLQIENEYYSTIRPKQVPINNEPPTSALRERGVSYVELRSLDVNAFDPLGINESQLYFLESFLLYCQLYDSVPIDEAEQREIDHNELIVAHRGREPGLKLQRNGNDCSLRDWALEICADIAGVCDVLDAGYENKPFSTALAEQVEVIREPEATPSARMLRNMRENKESFFTFALRQSKKHERFFKTASLEAERKSFFVSEAKMSWQRQVEIESGDKLSFEKYLAKYFDQI